MDEPIHFEFRAPRPFSERMLFAARQQGVPLEYFIARALSTYVLLAEERARGTKVLLEDSRRRFRLLIEPTVVFGDQR